MRYPITNPKKILFPKSKITKEEFVNYYKKIAKWILPLVKGRPISLKRFPNGVKKEKFFQKKAMDYYPKWIKLATVKRKDQPSIKMPLITNLDSLLYIANQVGEIHIWLSRIDKPDIPDRLIFDLDPPKDGFSKIKEAAKDMKKLLADLKLPCFLMTSGSKGLHVVVPVKRQKTFREVKDFSKKVAKLLETKFPKKYTTIPGKGKRKGKVFIDYLRNESAQTTIAPYSIRALEHAPIAIPIEFNEISKINPQSFNIKNISKRKKNPFINLEAKAVSLKNAEKKLNKLLESYNDGLKK